MSGTTEKFESIGRWLTANTDGDTVHVENNLGEKWDMTLAGWANSRSILLRNHWEITG